MKIVHLITTLDPGGAETMLIKLATCLASETGIYQHVVCIAPNGLLVPQLRRLGISVSCLGMRKRLNDVLCIAKLNRILKQYEPDIFQTWLYHADLLGTFASFWSGIKNLVWNLRCSNMVFSKSPATGIIVPLLAKLSAFPRAIVSNSEAGLRHHQSLGYRNANWVVIPNGFDTDRFRPSSNAKLQFCRQHELPTDTIIVGMMARFDEMKDFTTLFKAVAMVRNMLKGRKVVLVCAGQGVDESNPLLMDMISNLGLRSFVRLLGYRSDPEFFYQALDIHVLASKGEGFPNVVGEAMACAVPCIASDVGDVKSMLGSHGALFPPGDSRALAKALVAYIELGKDRRDKIGQEARKRIIANFSISTIADRYLEFYKSLL